MDDGIVTDDRLPTSDSSILGIVRLRGIVTGGHPDAGKFSLLLYRGNTLSAVENVDGVVGHMVARCLSRRDDPERKKWLGILESLP